MRTFPGPAALGSRRRRARATDAEQARSVRWAAASSFHPPVAPLQLQDAGTEVPRSNESRVGGWFKKEVDGTAAAVGAGVAEPSRRSQRLRARRRQAVVSRFPVGAKARWPRRCRSGALGRSQVPSACAVDDKKVLPVPLLRLLPRSCPIGCFSSVTHRLPPSHVLSAGAWLLCRPPAGTGSACALAPTCFHPHRALV